jgi:hypothetical protein
MRNVTTGGKNRTINGRPYIDLGGGAPGSTKDPDVFYPEPNSVKGAQVSQDFTSDLWEYISFDSSTPPVAWGRKDGKTQQSGVSNEILFGPLLWHLREERVHERAAQQKIAKLILAIALAKGVNGITEPMMELEPRCRLAKLMDRARMDLVNEMVTRMPVGLVDVQSAVQRLDEGEGVDVEEVIANIQAVREEEQQAEMDAAQQDQEAQMAMMKTKAALTPKKQANPSQVKK